MEPHNPTINSENNILKQENQRLTEENHQLNLKIKLLEQQMESLLNEKSHA